ncbi:hypothetical protein VOLCADRAFT_94250 [Volvox carteri f. nagariensis]|uniref:Transmembrane protein n=1 Tax=Volvox carteri f. nagariensis TaxID=3068 RepID=D8U405_VOLCA|nr:uncharacterized protein VOLCADRAFT_94250 [Volvox carteri f. nagariensis]EFJ45512.1 hypothetical protein VOLCADRAFT_94250 [Volvox carteri f. nagariensis]|eukprot:XP_002953539.1 hypothetical protein VOLCADRAFT_94250 [Volvox carteri f. nagariensis]
MSEPPFLQGPMSAEMEAQRAEQATEFCMRQLRNSEEFKNWMVQQMAKQQRSARFSGARRIGLYILGLVCAGLLVYGSLQYYATVRDPIGDAAAVMVADTLQDAIGATVDTVSVCSLEPLPSSEPAIGNDEASLEPNPPQERQPPAMAAQLAANEALFLASVSLALNVVSCLDFGNAFTDNVGTAVHDEIPLPGTLEALVVNAIDSASEEHAGDGCVPTETVPGVQRPQVGTAGPATSDVAVLEQTAVEVADADDTIITNAQSGSRSACSWGSSQASVGGQSYVPLGACYPVVESRHANGARITHVEGSTPWPALRLLKGNAASSSASHASDGDTTIFDLNRFDDNGEEVVSIPLVVKGTVAQPEKEVCNRVPRRHVKLRFPSRKPAPSNGNMKPPHMDVLYPGMSVPRGNNSSEASRLQVQAGDTQKGSEEATPTWPPVASKAPASAFGLEDMDDALISSEAESVVRSLLRDDPAVCQPSATSGKYSEPSYSPTTAEETLLDLDLAPHSYTASTGACKALAYNTAVTPVSVMPNNGSNPSIGTCVTGGHDVSEGGSWASIGSRIASDRPVPDSEDGASSQLANGFPSPALLVPVQMTSPLHTSGSGAAAAASADGDVWANGQLPLPEDIDSYVASLHAEGASSSACVLTSFQSSLSFAGLLINSVSRQLYLAQQETAMWQARVEALEAARMHTTDQDFHVDAAVDNNCELTWVCVGLDSESVTGSITDEGSAQSEGCSAAEALLKHAVIPCSASCPLDSDYTPNVEINSDVKAVVEELLDLVEDVDRQTSTVRHGLERGHILRKEQL